jgi:hypothetical protein
MTATPVRLSSDADTAWRTEFRALVLEIDRLAVAMDVRCWRRTAPEGSLSVIEHLQLLNRRWRAVPVVAPIAFVPDPAPGAAVGDGTVRAVRPAALLRAWRRAGRSFPDRLAASYARAGGSADAAQRQYLAEITALRRCLAAFHAATSAGQSPQQDSPSRNQ